MPSIWIGELECSGCGHRFKRRYAAERAEHIERGECPNCGPRRSGLGKPYIVFHRLAPDNAATERLRRVVARELARPVA